MGARKFYYGDIGEIIAYPGAAHTGHRVRIAGTVIRKVPNTRNRVRYTVDCECGKNLSLDSRKMKNIQHPDPFPTPQEACYRRFLEETRIPGVDELNKRLSILKPRWEDCLRRYYGLNIEGRRETLQPIGDFYGITRERVRQIIARSMIAVTSVDNAVVH